MGEAKKCDLFSDTILKPRSILLQEFDEIVDTLNYETGKKSYWRIYQVLE